MKNYFVYMVLALCCLPAVAQNKARQVLYGKIKADSVSVENINIKNLSTNIGAVTDIDGAFTIYARATDTLSFSGINLHAVKLVVQEPHLLQSPLIITMYPESAMLDEVVINSLTGSLENDGKAKTAAIGSQFDAYNITKIPKIQQKANINTALPQMESQLQGVDFVQIYKSVFRKKKGKQDRGEIYGSQQANFQEVVKTRFTHYFFTQTLKIPREEIGLFLVYCDKGAETAGLLDPEKEFELTDYLITKAKEYLGAKPGN